ncbi:MAG: hypothetical protein F4X77_12595 [Acidobacteriia bacterium]|nr:hypothetical protein [Terriglobia bacterium]
MAVLVVIHGAETLHEFLGQGFDELLRDVVGFGGARQRSDTDDCQANSGDGEAHGFGSNGRQASAIARTRQREFIFIEIDMQHNDAIIARKQCSFAT